MQHHDATPTARWDDRTAPTTTVERVCGFATDHRMGDARVEALGHLVTGAIEAARALRAADDALCVRVAMDAEWLTLVLDGVGDGATTMTLEFAVEPQAARVPQSLLVTY